MSSNRPFIDRLLPAPVGGGFEMPGYWVWCGSPIKAQNPGEDGRYHLFASRWPKALSMSPHWLFNSEVVRAVSDTPEGPYEFAEVVLPARGREHFDGLVTHNPSIKFWNGIYWLFYLGVSYEGPVPTVEHPLRIEDNPADKARYLATWAHKRIGLAWSRSINGPWQRPERSLFDPRPGKWDAVANTNPSACIRPDGHTVLIYKSRTVMGGPLQLGIATAPTPAGPYTRVSDAATFHFDDPEQHLEDPFIWYEDGMYQVIMKDMTGGVTGESHSGIHAVSEDGLHWRIAPQPKAYSRIIRWDDGTVTTQGSFERPNLLIQDGRPTHLFAATADGPGGFWNASRTWNMVIPLRQD
jgi:hypothetical protein